MMQRTAADRAYALMIDDITTQALQPGVTLREDDLARRCEMSRTPVREALRRLVQDGLVERHRSHLRVRLLDSDQIEQIYPVVGVVEGLAARLAARHITSDDLTRLEILHEQMKEHAAADRTHQYVKTNQNFHDLVLACARNETLTREVERMRLVTMQLRHYQLGLYGRMEMSAREHASLLKSLRDGDEDAAEVKMRQHVESAHEMLIRAVTGAPILDLEDAYRLA